MIYFIIVLSLCSFFIFFKQKTAYEMRISDCSSDVCSSDLALRVPQHVASDVASIAAGGYHSVLRKTDGSVGVTGSNGSGQIGLGQGTQSVAAFQRLELGRAHV